MSSLAKTEETALVLEVIMSFKEYLTSIELLEADDVAKMLPSRIEIFEKVTSEFIEITESLKTCFRYFNELTNCLRGKGRQVLWQNAKNWMCEMIDKFVTDKIIDAEKLIIENVQVLYRDLEGCKGL